VTRGAAIPLTIAVGALIAIQAPVNSRLGRSVGSFPAAIVSFAIGLLALLAVALLVDHGIRNLGGAPWWAYAGGLLGAAYVVVALVTVRTLGVGGVTAATIAGQLTMAVVIDRFGWFGVQQQPLGVARIAGVALLAAGVVLIITD
jgi:transporter family-2 protein